LKWIFKKWVWGGGGRDGIFRAKDRGGGGALVNGERNLGVSTKGGDFFE